MQDTERAFHSARDRYNKIIALGSNIDIVKLLELAAGLPDAPPVKESRTKAIEKGFFAYSRTDRRKPDGTLERHDISVTKYTDGSIDLTCTCPGFEHHGHCWASTEAKQQFLFPGTRKAGTNGVHPKYFA